MTSRLTLLTILLFTFNVNAQDLDTVTISGRIMDQNGAVVPGAEVQATLVKTRLRRTTTSDAGGRYRVAGNGLVLVGAENDETALRLVA